VPKPKPKDRPPGSEWGGNEPPAPGTARRTRALFIWSALALILLLVIESTRSRVDRGELTYTALITQVTRDNVAGVEIAPDRREVTGTLRAAITVDDRSVTAFHTYLPFTDPAPLVQQLEAHKVPISATSAGTSWVTFLLSMLPWILLAGFWIVIARQMRAGGERALSFGRAGVRPVAGERPDVTFADVAGADEAKAELQEVIDFLREPDRFQRLGGHLPKGVLLVGPPGTGKTLLARAVAGEAGVPFYSISGSDFVEMFVGVGASRVRSLFQQGKANAPCIIFIDELDAVGRQRGIAVTGGHEEREQTLNQLLVELDGFTPTEGVVVLSATNRPDVLDPALLRPGRFDRQIVVDLPDVRAREKILAVHARKIPLAADVKLDEIARGTPGLSGADLANLVNEAALFAARRGKEHVDRADFEDAKDKVMLGVERRSLVLSENERRLTAYHEAGHALVNVLVPGLDPVHKVTIVPRGRALGITASLPEEDRHSHTRAYILGRLAVAYGGRIAEELIFGPDQVTTGAALDFQQATDLARRMVTQFGMSDAIGPIAIAEREEAVLGPTVVARQPVSEHTADLVDREVRRIVEEAYARARELLTTHLDALHALAAALLEHETLERAEVEAIVAQHPAQPAPSGNTRRALVEV